MPDKPAVDERRSSQRKPVKIPVKLRHAGTEHHALTRDLSSSGIFLYSESGIKPGSKLELVIMLPSDLGVGPGGWTLCDASVVRIEQEVEDHVEDRMPASHGKRIGIAATIDRMALLPEIT